MKRTRTLRRDLLDKVATISLVATFLAGCSSAVERFGEPPYYTGNTQNQRQILDQPSYQDIVDGPGGTAAGLPPASSQPVTTGSVSTKPSPIQSAPLPAPVQTASAPVKTTPVPTLPAPEVAQPPVASVSTANAKSWKGWTSAGGTKVQVRQGDDLNSMSRRFGVPVQALVAVNGIEDPKNVKPGQSIIIPTYVHSDGSRPVVTASIPASSGNATRTPERKPFSQPSFTQISKSEAVVEEVDIIRVSSLPKRKPAGVGRPLTTASISQNAPVSNSSAPRKQPVVTPVATAPSGTVETSALPQPAVVKEAPPTEPIKTPAVVASLQEDTTVSTEQFRWPVRGRIISDFGAKPGGGRNEGVNLAVPEGTPVKAADDGTVIYSGNELKGYGNLVLVRHSEGWVSAYAHNSELKVKRGDKIRRGDVVGLAGATGSVNQPQVHFELRKGNKPVDPLKHLPQR